MDYKNRNFAMMTDLYQLTMMNNYFKLGKHEDIAVFDVFFRKNANKYVSYNIFAGLEQVIEYINNLCFKDEDIEYLRSLNIFDNGFLEYLRNMKFTGEIYSVEEGSVVFPQEPLIRVKAPLIEGQLIETAILNIINFQTLIASKTSYIINAAKGAGILEFGLRRAQGCDAGFYGARAAYIAGALGTSNVLAGEHLGIPVTGTMSHSYIMSFENELDAFMSYAKEYPDKCLLLVDTFNTLGSGVPNAIKAFDYLREKGYEPAGIRIDSGDLAYLSKNARKMLDEAGYEEVQICASGDLDEHVIEDLISQGAEFDSYGVGTRLITGWDNPALGGVYKMSAIEKNGEMVPKMKLSDNIQKTTNPGIKKVYRIFDNKTGKAEADLITLENESIDETKPLVLYDPVETWKVKEISNFTTEELLVPVFIDGKQVYDNPGITEIRDKCIKNMDRFWDEYKRLTKPHKYKVDLSDKLYDLKKEFMLTMYKKA